MGTLVAAVLVIGGVASYESFSPTGDRPAGRTSPSTPGQGTSTPVRTQATVNQVAEAAGCPADPDQQVNSLQFATPAKVLADATLYAATIKTTAGTFRISLDQLEEPQAVNSFVFLADEGYFNCNSFDRVVPGELDQTGDPTGTGSGGPGYFLPVERPPISKDPSRQYAVGDVVLANGGHYDAGASQWFIVTGPQGEALPANYSLFGEVISGMNVVLKINQEGSPSGEPGIIERVLSVSIQSKQT